MSKNSQVTYLPDPSFPDDPNFTKNPSTPTLYQSTRACQTLRNGTVCGSYMRYYHTPGAAWGGSSCATCINVPKHRGAWFLDPSGKVRETYLPEKMQEYLDAGWLFLRGTLAPGVIVSKPAKVNPKQYSRAKINPNFGNKNTSSVTVHVTGGTHKQKRTHQKYVNKLNAFFKGANVDVTDGMRPDLVVLDPFNTVIEVKVVRENSISALFQAIRDSVSQPVEYTEWITDVEGFQPAICLTRLPKKFYRTSGGVKRSIVQYIEKKYNVLALWFEKGAVRGGPQAVAKLGAAGVK